MNDAASEQRKATSAAISSGNRVLETLPAVSLAWPGPFRYRSNRGRAMRNAKRLHTKSLPPSTLRVAPVMKVFFRDAQNAMTSAISLGRPTRPKSIEAPYC